MSAKKTTKKETEPSKAAVSMRDLASNSSTPKKSGRLKNTVGRASAPLSNFRKKLPIKYRPIKASEKTKAGRLLNKRIRFVPGFLRNAWAEVRQTTWPGRRETIRLSFAVFVFAAIFAVVVFFLDLGLSKFFKEFIIKV